MKVDQPQDLAGSELSAVAFVRGYLELHFDGPVLRALTPTSVITPDGAVIDPTAAEWRNALCALIGAPVESVLVLEDAEIVVRFGGGTRVVIPLSQSSRRGPEAAHFIPHWDEPFFIW